MLSSTASKKLLGGLILLIVLSICLCLTTFALVYSMISLENNIFKTGVVSIDLNGGKPIIEDSELLFAPGMSEQKTFYIKSNSTCDVYYRVYFENVTGSLAPCLDVTILDGEDILYTGKASNLTQETTKTADREIAIGECRELTITFSFPKDQGEGLQSQHLTFDLRADAVQAKNNLDKAFD